LLEEPVLVQVFAFVQVSVIDVALTSPA